MGEIWYDDLGSADMSFHGIPLRVIKKASFRNVAGTLHDLIKMTVNSVTYDFNQTRESGAVIFMNNYSHWEFVAPDDRLDFAGYSSMSLGSALQSIRDTLVSNPIPAWDKFASWVYNQSAYPKYVVSQCTAYIRPVDGGYTLINTPDFMSMGNTGFVGFLDVLINALELTSLPMSDYKTGDTSFACDIMLRNGDTTLIVMRFTFRE